MTFPVGEEVSLDQLLESRESIEREINQRISNELAELDLRQAVLRALLREEPEVFCDQDYKLKSRNRSIVSPAKPAKETRIVAVAKYRDPDSGKLWSGKGKRPRWFDVNRADEFLLGA